jgi:hypothetical protein
MEFELVDRDDETEAPMYIVDDVFFHDQLLV